MLYPKWSDCMGETGLVTAIEGDKAIVSLTRTEACAQCRACTMGMQKEEMLLRARNACGAKIGDMVEIALVEGVFLRAMAIMYLVPFAALLAGLGLGWALGGWLLPTAREWIAFGLGVGFLLPAFLIIKRNESRIAGKARFAPEAVAVVARENE